MVDLASAGGDPGSGRIYVECRSDGLLVHPDEVVVTREELDDPVRWIDGPFGRCLTQVRSRGPGGSVYFLVRRGGIPVFRRAVG